MGRIPCAQLILPFMPWLAQRGAKVAEVLKVSGVEGGRTTQLEIPFNDWEMKMVQNFIGTVHN